MTFIVSNLIFLGVHDTSCIERLHIGAPPPTQLEKNGWIESLRWNESNMAFPSIFQSKGPDNF